MHTNNLYHHGIKGQKWGIRRFQNKDGTLTSAGAVRYAVESRKQIIINSDGSKTIPKGFKFNRVGKRAIDVNKSGGLYVSYGVDDASRYVKLLGPTPINNLLKRAGEAVQHISVNAPIRMPSDEETSNEMVNFLRENKDTLSNFNKSFYAYFAIGRFITEADLDRALENPTGKLAKKISYSVSAALADEKFANDAKILYDRFRGKGFDAILDYQDRMSGTSNTALIIINPEKVKVASSTVITKDIMRNAKKYVRSLEKLKISDILT